MSDSFDIYKNTSISRLCPHCSNELAMPPINWLLQEPWHCSYCGEAFCVGSKRFHAIPQDMRPLAPIFGFQVTRRYCFYVPDKHYVYALCLPNGLPFYVGCGRKNRVLSHEMEVHRKTEPIQWTEKHDTILRIRMANEDVWYHFLALVDTKKEAEAIEAYWIDRWGIRSQSGFLTNLSPAREALIRPEWVEDRPPPPEVTDAELLADGRTRNHNVIKVFQHPDMVVSPPPGSATRSGAILACLACGVPGQVTAGMKYAKILCGNCGHFMKLH